MADTDLLDQLVKSAPWLVIPATLLTAAPKILEFWQGFAGVHDGRKQLEIEKARLENLKLRIEIEALKKKHGVSFEGEEIPTAHQILNRPANKRAEDLARKMAKKKVWGWVNRIASKRPGLAGAVVNGVATICTWLAIFALLFYITLGIESWFTDPKEEAGYFLLGGFFMLLLPGFLVFRIGSSFKTQRQLLQNRVKPVTATTSVPAT